MGQQSLLKVSNMKIFLCLSSVLAVSLAKPQEASLLDRLNPFGARNCDRSKYQIDYDQSDIDDCSKCPTRVPNNLCLLAWDDDDCELGRDLFGGWDSRLEVPDTTRSNGDKDYMSLKGTKFDDDIDSFMLKRGCRAELFDSHDADREDEYITMEAPKDFDVLVNLNDYSRQFDEFNSVVKDLKNDIGSIRCRCS